VVNNGSLLITACKVARDSIWFTDNVHLYSAQHRRVSQHVPAKLECHYFKAIGSSHTQQSSNFYSLKITSTTHLFLTVKD